MSYSIRTRLHHWIEQCPCTNFLVKNKKEQEQVDGIWYDVVVVECLVKAEHQKDKTIKLPKSKYFYGYTNEGWEQQQ